MALDNTGDQLDAPKVALYRDGSTQGTIDALVTANCTDSSTPVTALTATNGAANCTSVTYDLDATDKAANQQVSLLAKVTGTWDNSTGTTTDPYSAVSASPQAGGVVKYGAFAVTAAATPATAVGTTSTVTFTFTNSGPSTVTNVNVTGTGVQTGLGAPAATCTSQTVAAATWTTQLVPATVSTCTFTYTVQAGDFAASDFKTLNFGVVAANTADMKTFATAAVAVNVTVDRTFSTTFTPDDCVLKRTVSETGAPYFALVPVPAQACCLLWNWKKSHYACSIP